MKDLSPLGIEVAALSVLLQECRNFVDTETCTLDQFVNDFVKVVTSDKKCSLCELWEAKFPGYIGKANAFVSCWRGSLLKDTVDTLCHSLGENSIKCVWIDVVSCSQHADIALGKTGKPLEGLKQFIKLCGEFILVIPSVKVFKPLQRLWCLFECYCASVEGCDVSIALNSDACVEAVSLLCRNTRFVLTTIFEHLNVSRARCSLEEDLDGLHRFIGTSQHETTHFQTSVSKCILPCLVDLTKKLKADCLSKYSTPQEDSQDSQNCLLQQSLFDRSIGAILIACGHLDEAAGYIDRALEYQRSACGTDGHTTLGTTIVLCELLYEQQQFPKCENHCREVLIILQSSGKAHARDIIDCMTILARSIDAQGRRKEAQKLYTECDYLCGKHLLQYQYFNPHF